MLFLPLNQKVWPFPICFRREKSICNLHQKHRAFCWVLQVMKIIHPVKVNQKLQWYDIPGLPPYKKQGNHRKSCMMMIYEDMKVIENSIEVHGNMQAIKRHTMVWFHASHTLYHSMAIVWCHGGLLGQSFASSGCRRCLHQDEDHSGSRPHSFPGLY